MLRRLIAWGNDGVDVKNFFSVSGDNNLVIGWWGKTDHVNIDNYIAYFPEHAGIAQTSAIFAQGIEGTQPGEDTSSMGTVRIKNFYAIKQTNVLGSIWGKILDNIDNFTIENLYTEPGSTRDNLLYFDLNVSSNKNFNLKNIYFDKTAGGYLSDKYYVRFDNVNYNGNLVSDAAAANVMGAGKVQVLNGKSAKHYEFENGQLNGAVAADKNYASFGKAVAVMSSAGSFIEVTVDVPVAGNYTLDIAYANGSGTDGGQSVYVNGIYQFQALFPKTNAGWDQSAASWKKVNVGTVNLKAGTNKIKLQRDSIDIYPADLDYLEVNP
ncbi:CBM35 domain-containing protein [Paenibacillus sp. D2_2]|uniref:CBM35 domain-containing protein n=1 Tax=Paenibacillus sp. D2_2 TaxID=3073092 RepID=UPI00281553A2|nr:CBM35 domain-containing protein [Paenibacillus sp. D2_2]WMT41791.1 CBM35 domain-containing protein [Paenibacillus sp. D2_2]